MSTVSYIGSDNKEYSIGEIGWEGPNTISQAFDALVPTYGLWAGPGWAGGFRVLNSEDIDWNTMACYNDTIKGCTDLEHESQYHYSLVDAICKKHDWEYYRAECREKNGKQKDSNQIIMNADLGLLKSTSEISSQLATNGAAAYECLVPNHEYEYVYIGQLDAEEARYSKMVAAAFAVKLTMWDAAKSLWSEAVDYFKGIWGGTKEESFSEGSSTVKVTEQNNVIVYENFDAVTRIDKGWSLALATEKACMLPKVKFAVGSVRPDITYEISEDNVCTVHGGNGNDRIFVTNNGSHQAELVLEGGGGNDTYDIASGIGNLTILDDGENFISWGGRRLAAFYKDGDEDIWKTFDGKQQVSHCSPWKITFEDGTTITLEEGSSPDDFGINLIDAPDDPSTTLTTTGDLAPIDFDPNTPGVQIQYDALGNIITDPNTPEPDRADTLYDSTGNDSIVGGGGNDQILAENGGDDWLKGGSGNDGIVAGSGHDILEGGTGADLLFGGTDDDRLFAEDMGEMSDLVEAGETAVGITGQGDLLSGGEGNDFLYGSDRNDALFGGAGSDLLVGGGDATLVHGRAARFCSITARRTCLGGKMHGTS